jgi:hypothetical protein
VRAKADVPNSCYRSALPCALPRSAVSAQAFNGACLLPLFYEIEQVRAEGAYHQLPDPAPVQQSGRRRTVSAGGPIARRSGPAESDCSCYSVKRHRTESVRVEHGFGRVGCAHAKGVCDLWPSCAQRGRHGAHLGLPGADRRLRPEPATPCWFRGGHARCHATRRRHVRCAASMAAVVSGSAVVAGRPGRRFRAFTCILARCHCYVK